MVPDYTKPTEFTTGQLLGRATASILRDNDDYFWGLAHGWRAIPGNLCDVDSNGTIWDGWHYYKTDATALDYYVTTDSGGDPGSRIRLYYDYNGDNQHIIVDPNAEGTVTSDTQGLWDIVEHDTEEGYTTREEGLYRVACVATGGVTGYCRPPFTVYTGDQTYGTPPIVWDGDTSSTGLYNRVRLNDLYFNDCKPTNPAFSGMRRSGSSVNCWDGWDYHHGTRIYYRVVLPANWGAGDSFSIQYDYGGGGQEEVLSITTAGTHESYYDLTGTFTPGQRYRVTCRTDSGRLADVQYIFIEPQTTDVGPGINAALWRYYVMHEFTVGNIVLGRIPPAYGPSTVEMSLLSDNDRHVFSALCASAKVGRRDYAVRKPTVALNSTAYAGDLRIVHRYDTLVYRTLDGELVWDDNDESLDDYTSDDAYQVLDLRGLNLQYGQVYKVVGVPVVYAAEIP